MSRLDINEKVKMLENKGFNWLEISDILEIPYEQVRNISEEIEQAEKKFTKQEAVLILKEIRKDISSSLKIPLQKVIEYIEENGK